VRFAPRNGILEVNGAKGGIYTMSFDKIWYTLEEAESKFGVQRGRILEWVEEGIVRCEHEKDKVVRINSDDLELKLSERP
jgi:hypothetical protein